MRPLKSLLTSFVLLLVAAAAPAVSPAASHERESSCARALAAAAASEEASPCEANGIDKQGLEQIAREEAPGGKPVKKPYNDTEGFCTIGIGHLLHKSRCDKGDTKRWKNVTKAELENLFKHDLKQTERELDALLKKLKLKLTPCQYDALADLLYNGGPSWFVSPKSRIYKALAAGELDSVPKLIEEAVPGKADAKTKRAISKRRAREAAEFKQSNCCPDWELVYHHSSSFTYSGEPEHVAAAPRKGTEARSESWRLAAKIPLAGEPSTGLSGSGPIDYEAASYHLEWKGEFTGQAICPGTIVDDLIGTSAGTASVPSLTISSPSAISLRFLPEGEDFEGGPTETIRDIQTYEVCPGADNTIPSELWTGRFLNFYEAHGLWASGPTGAALIDSGWAPGKGKVYATRTIAGDFPANTPSPGAGSWTDTYELIEIKPKLGKHRSG